MEEVRRQSGDGTGLADLQGLVSNILSNARIAGNRDSQGGPLKPAQLRMSLNVPVSVWVEGEDPVSAIAGQVFLVGRDFLRVRVPKSFPPGTRVRFKTQARSR